MHVGGVSAAAGPIGTGGQVSASLANPAPMFSYSRSKGMSYSVHLPISPVWGAGA